MKNLILTLCISGLIAGCGGSSEPLTPVVIDENTGSVETKTKEQGINAVLTSWADNYILPSYQDLSLKSEEFEQAAMLFCSEPSALDSHLGELKNAWQNLSASWQYTKAIRLGPGYKNFKHFRLQIWPDGNAAIPRGVATLLASETALIDELLVSQTQDGAQGIPALEYLIYQTQPEFSLLTAPDKEKRCLTVMAIAANVKTIVTEIDAKWQQSVRDEYINGTGEFFITAQGALEKQLTNWFELMEIIVDDKINKVMKEAAPGKVENAENYLSLTSLENIKQNILALETIYLGADGYGLNDYLLEVNQAEALDNTIKNAFSNVFTSLDKIETSLELAITNNESRLLLTELISKLTALRSVMASDFVQTTQLNPGVNSTDGD